ncbi:MAG: cytochrome c biogenesis protein CcdA [Spirochaetota bacterium]
MMELFTWLTNALQSTVWIAIAASFVWGVLSIVLSPCHLASIPLIIGYIDDQGIRATARAFVVSLLFSLGILITIALVGVVTALAGRMMGDVGIWGNVFVAIIFFIIGLHLLEIITVPFLQKSANPKVTQKGLWSAFMLGLVFGIALGPCTFAYMAPMLGVAFQVAATKILFAIALVTMYAIGHCSVIVIAGTSYEVVQRYLNWNERSKGAVIVKKACGLLVIGGGVYLIFSVL